MQSVFDTNPFGVVRVLHAFLPLLDQSSAPLVVNVSSGLALTRGPVDPESTSYFYPAVAYHAVEPGYTPWRYRLVIACASVREVPPMRGVSAADTHARGRK